MYAEIVSSTDTGDKPPNGAELMGKLWTGTEKLTKILYEIASCRSRFIDVGAQKSARKAVTFICSLIFLSQLLFQLCVLRNIEYEMLAPL
jgi:hypothetical protein